MHSSTSAVETPTEKMKPSKREGLPKVPASSSLSGREGRRQTNIRKLITQEQQYIRDLDLLESVFIRPLRDAQPPIIRPSELHEFIDELFGNILDLRDSGKRFLEVLSVRQREQGEVISQVGDVFLEAAAEFRRCYPTYIGNLPMCQMSVKDGSQNNAKLRLFLEQCSRHADNADKQDLRHFLNRPSQHLQKYPALLEAIHKETADSNPDKDIMSKAIEAMKNLQGIAQLRTFQSAMGRGPTGKFDWHSLMPEEVRWSISKQEIKRQSIIFELIKGEMAYVKDLENIEYMYVRPLRGHDPPIIPRNRSDLFIQDVFHNFMDLHAHHRRMLEQFHVIQIQEYPFIRSIAAVMLDTLLNLREAYLEYIPNYPIAAYRIDDEMANNPAFKAFVHKCTRHPDAHRLDIKNFAIRPIPRLLRYELLLRTILEQTPEGHEDLDKIPVVIDVIKDLGKESEPGVVSAKQKLELWWYSLNVVFNAGEAVPVQDMDLLHENRSLIHTGKFLRQPDTGFEFGGWTELFVFLFDNYLVMTKPKEKDGVTKYHVYRRPIPLDLLTLAAFNDPPTQRGNGLIPFRGKGVIGTGHTDSPSPGFTLPGASGSPETIADVDTVYPCKIHHDGRLGGALTLFTETAQARLEWKAKMEEAIGLRKVVQESNKVFEVEILNTDTFLAPSMLPNPLWTNDNIFTGEVTCSVSFSTSDGRSIVAIGCAEGVWTGLRHDLRSMRQLLRLKMVTQCAMLGEFGIFLVLAENSLLAYHIEDLDLYSSDGSSTTQTPQKVSGNDDVQFFSAGNFGGRTLVIYTKKRGLESAFRVLEPLNGNIDERVKESPSRGSPSGLGSPQSDWFRVHRDFSLPSESYDLLFMKAKIAILCKKGFELVDPIESDSRSITIPSPQREDPRLEKLAKRCESCQPIGMFQSKKDEFLLCYDEFGLYVDEYGGLSRETGTIEWEGAAERVAWNPPYVLLFNSNFIEIRHVETGRLVQVIAGNGIRCVWDGRGAFAANLPDEDKGVSQESRVHGVMNADSTQPGRPEGEVMQHVFELRPMVPLCPPGSLSSPSHASYFNHSSPPHSLRLNPPLSSSYTSSL